MDLIETLKSLVEANPKVLLVCSALGALVIIAQAVVVFTPSKKDDEAVEKFKSHPIFGKLIEALTFFAPIKKK